jgi:hypothetical protein
VVKDRIRKSLTFGVGLLLFVGAFIALLVAGSILNPPPYRVVIAVADINPYTVLTREMLAVDSQTMNSKVASRLVHESEVDMYVGGLVVEAVHGGEPLRRNAVVAQGNPAAVHRLSLALTDPNIVALVVPVDAKNIPSNVTSGDYVNITMGIPGSVSQLATQAFGQQIMPGLAPVDETGKGPEQLPEEPRATVPPASTPVATGTLPIIATPGPGEEGPPVVGGKGVEYPSEQEREELDVRPPLVKVILPQVTILSVVREKIPNPNYGMGMGEGSEMQPAYLEGEIESVTVLVPGAAEELLYFAVDNGSIHVSVVPHTAVEEGASPSTGILWNDIVDFIEAERAAALGVVTDTVASGVAPGATRPVTGTVTPGEGEKSEPTAVPEPEGEATATPRPEAQPTKEAGATDALGMSGGIVGLIVPVCVGGAVVFGVAAIIFMLRRQKSKKGP